MKDLNILLDDNKRLNVRVGAVIVKENKVLLTKDGRFSDGRPLLTVPGGRVKFGESTYEALKRELFEELGEGAVCLNEGVFVCLDETFFEWQGEDVHEYGFYYLFDGGKLPDIEGKHACDNVEVTFHWIDVSDMDKYAVYPNQLQRAVAGKFTHIVNKQTEQK